jgi:polar amino acid transport system substrate-binding protein
MPWKRGYAGVLGGEFDATFPYVETEGRRAEMLFSDPIYEFSNRPVFRAGEHRAYAGPESLIGLVLCEPIGYAPPRTLSPLVRSGALQVVQPASMTLCLRQLQAGRVDLVVTSEALFGMEMRRMPADAPRLEMAGEPIEHNFLFLLAARGDPKAGHWIQAFNRGLAALRTDGRYDAIVQRHLAVSARD